MKKDVHHSGRKRSGDTEVAKPLVHVDEMAKAVGRSTVLSRKLLSQQKRIHEAQRPLHQIQRFPEIVHHIREYVIPEHQNLFDTPIDRAVMQRLSACLTEPITPCLSFHFPLPGCANQLIEKIEDWDEIQDTLAEWATRELDAIACVFIDVENLSEGCRECIGFTRHCFPGLDTVNTLLNKYLRDYLKKLESRIAHLVQVEATSTVTKEKNAARKEADKLKKALKDCQDWERNVILPLAQQRLEIDLDDGVKTNYLKFVGAVQPIAGLAAKED